jgi:hypothetical protein
MPLQLAAIGIFSPCSPSRRCATHTSGIAMFGAACGVGLWLAGMPLADVLAGFPTRIMILLVGVTYFFAIAQQNGTIDRVLEVVLRRVGSNAVSLPVDFFRAHCRRLPRWARRSAA